MNRDCVVTLEIGHQLRPHPFRDPNGLCVPLDSGAILSCGGRPGRTTPDGPRNESDLEGELDCTLLYACRLKSRSRNLAFLPAFVHTQCIDLVARVGDRKRRVIEDIEHLPTELEIVPLRDLPVLVDACVTPLLRGAQDEVLRGVAKTFPKRLPGRH